MDLKLLGTTFVAVFLAEVGDKTNLATMSLAAGSASRWAVFAGAALALILTSALSVFLGDTLARLVPPIWIRRGAGLLFVAIGVVFLLARDAGGVAGG